MFFWVLLKNNTLISHINTLFSLQSLEKSRFYVISEKQSLNKGPTPISTLCCVWINLMETLMQQKKRSFAVSVCEKKQQWSVIVFIQFTKDSLKRKQQQLRKIFCTVFIFSIWEHISHILQFYFKTKSGMCCSTNRLKPSRNAALKTFIHSTRQHEVITCSDLTRSSL